MATIITVTESSSMPGRFTCSHKTGTGRPRSGEAGSDPAAAAAYAMEIALNVGGPYVIFGPQKVMDHIPPEFRSRR